MNSQPRRWWHGYDVALRESKALSVFDLFAKRRDGSYHYWALHLPNFLCYLRITLGPVLTLALGWALWTGREAFAWKLLLVIAGLIVTDLFDGPLARHMGLDGLTHPVGHWNGGSLDATADKCLMIPMFLMTSTLTARLNAHLAGFVFVGLAVAVLICDSFLMYITVQEANRAAAIGRSGDLGPHAGQAGKWKVHAQAGGVILATVSLLIPWPQAHLAVGWAATGLLVFAVVLCLVSLRGHRANFRRIITVQAAQAGATKSVQKLSA